MTLLRNNALVALSPILLVVSLLLLVNTGNADEPVEEMTEDQKVSYTLGYMVMHRIASHGYHADVEAFSAGMQSVTGDTPPALNPDEMEAIMARVLKAVQIRNSQMEPADKPDTPDEQAEARAEAAAKVNLQAAPTMSTNMSLQLNTQIPSGRIDTASHQTKINQILSDNPNLDIRDIQ